MDVRKCVIQLSRTGQKMETHESARRESLKLFSNTLHSSSITKVCKGNRKYCMGYRWRYALTDEIPQTLYPKGGMPHSEYPSYLIYKDGQVYSTIFKRFLKQSSLSGYYGVTLSNKIGYKAKYIHRLVAETYIPNTKNKECVNHKDGNKLNNSVDNLEWVTHKENVIHAYRIGLNKGRKGKKIIKYTKSDYPEDIWKPISQNERYEISDHGRIYSHKSNRILMCQIHSCGYTLIRVGNKGESVNYRLHRLVAFAFFGKPPPELINPVVHHKDANRSNNVLSNLEWVSSSKNAEEAFKCGNRKYLPIMQYTIDGKYVSTYPHARAAAEKMGVQYQSIYKACTGENKTSCGYIWKYVDKN